MVLLIFSAPFNDSILFVFNVLLHHHRIQNYRTSFTFKGFVVNPNADFMSQFCTIKGIILKIGGIIWQRETSDELYYVDNEVGRACPPTTHLTKFCNFGKLNYGGCKVFNSCKIFIALPEKITLQR